MMMDQLFKRLTPDNNTYCNEHEAFHMGALFTFDWRGVNAD